MPFTDPADHYGATQRLADRLIEVLGLGGQAVSKIEIHVDCREVGTVVIHRHLTVEEMQAVAEAVTPDAVR